MSWKLGDVVRFAHQAKTGPDRRITALAEKWDGQFVEMDGMSGQYAAHLFVRGEDVMAITHDDIENWFTYHSPTDEQLPKYKAIREAGKMLAKTIGDNTPVSCF